ncbi:MAG: AraC family transcriptional regulator [Lachnospiraceae bacterium]|nr:AraC family transcriptional regulator [Lachnospiraceae bacterium]
MSKKLIENLDMSWSEDSIRYINTPSKKAKGLYFYVQEAGYFRAVPPYHTERANLDSFLIILTLSGEGRLDYLGQEYLCKPSTLMYINCIEHHRYECIPGSDWEFLWLHFNGPSALGYYEEFASNGFKLINEEDASSAEILREILRLSQEKELHYEPKISLLIAKLLTALLIKNSEESLGHTDLPDYINTALIHIEKHYADSLSLDSLAALSHVNKYHFAKQFTRYMQVTPNEYLITARLNHAKELLKYTPKTVDEISELCGFNQTSHFIRSFKTRIGITPLKYRRKWNG